MKLLEKLRYYSFWGLDILKGGKVRSHYKDIRYILENYNTEASKKRRALHLKCLLKHAVETVPYYKENKGLNLVEDFPVVNKIYIRNNYKNFVSEKYKDKSSFEVSTSGSTGTPFSVYLNKNKKNRNTADAIYFGEKAGYFIGQKLYYMRSWGNVSSKGKLSSFIQNIKKVNVKSVEDENFSNLVDHMRTNNSTKAILGYSSAYKEICKYLDKTNSDPITANITSMIANAEALGNYTKKSIKKYFDFDILSRYSNMENGIISQQIKEEGSSYHINWASYHVEILDMKSDKPVKYGVPGRVVITDLFNYHVPMIRYDTGDIAVMGIDENYFNGAPSFTKIEGRRMDVIYDTKGKPMTSVVYELEHFPEFKQFQLIQINKNTYLVKLNLDEVFQHEEKLKKMLQVYLGDDAIINIKYVDDMPQLSSGKRKLTMNKFLSV
ncbi:CoF synthetase [Algibacter sp. PT7-4]|uniref:CoF synthetase n=1 Tax=Algibacter ulvanivorans TaxID=3400999 RepID=UPI003AACDFE2